MGINTLYINGIELQNIYVDASLSYNKPERNVETFAIPGRNGALVIDNGTFSNVLINYPCAIKNGFKSAFSDLVNMLGALKGYQRIECSDDPEHYRLGRFIMPAAPTVMRLNREGRFDLAFDCKPQRFLLSGETMQNFTASGTITNPTNFDARPLLRIYGNGTITVNGVGITITDNGTYTDVDSEIQECYYGSTTRNNYVTFSGNDFPVLSPGINNIVFGSGITRCIVTPHWWEL